MSVKPNDEPEDDEEGTEEAHASNLTEDIPAGPKDNRTVELFYERLGARLNRVGIDLAKLDSKSGPDDPPPCYVTHKADFREWLRYASTGSIPLRMDMPGEPNYCHDCSPEFKGKAINEGSCLFPNTRFERRKELDEMSTVGVSRSKQVPPENYVVYQEMVVPVEALQDSLRKYAEHHVMGQPAKTFKLSDIPRAERPELDRINWNNGREKD